MKRLLSPIAFLVFAALPAKANVEIDPLVIEAEVPAGGSYSRTITLRNPRKEPMDVAIILMDWKYKEASGKKDLLQPGVYSRSCAPWITYSPNRLTIPPEKSGEVRFSLTAPKDVEGGYVATAMYRIAPPKPKASGQEATVGIGLQLTAPIFLQIAGTQRFDGAITAFEALDPKPGRPLNMRATFKNTGNVRVVAKGRLSILGADGAAKGWTAFPDIKTLPGDEWSVTASWKAGVPAGVYRLVGTFELAPGKILVEETSVKVE